MPHLTNWEAERGGYFQGTDTPGQLVGRVIDWFLDKIGKLPKLPKPQTMKDHWATWPEGKPIAISDEWLQKMTADGRLPSRERVTYSGAHEQKAEARAMSGSHIIVEMLDTDRKTRHRCILLGNVLIAPREGWDASLKR
jgi:hypothetical protein